MSFAIMRFAKLKTGAPITGAVSHIARSRPTPNADPARQHLNRSIVGPGHDDAAAIRSAIAGRTPDKFRKDAVRVLEFVVTATPDWFDQNPSQVDEYFDSAVDWLKQKFGSDNVVCAVQHNDESTPHAHIMVVPVDPDSGKLNAKRWVGGRGKMRQLQTDFANHQARFGVERGKPNPDRQHTTLAAWRDGHSKLDEREAALQEREREIAKEKADIESHRQKTEEIYRRNQALVEKFSGRIEQLKRDEEQVSKSAQEAAEAMKCAAARLEEAKALEGRLAALKTDLDKRETAYETRKRELFAAANQLDEWQENKRIWEAERDRWLAQHRPISLTAVQELSLDLAALPDDQRITQMRALFSNDRPMADAVDRLNWVTYDDGSVTPEGRKALVEHGSLQEHVRRETEWKRSGLDNGPKGP
ncbi:MobV family relaxase [Halomonas alkaliantarctica]|uniref:MobV family relaxase n=1 Tax=Halomonas alkaliantarctica TaxID=232346 RepID=UPI000690DF08|nr:MobV family relaxase [Halomonas alkaliantarctica]